MGAVISRTSQIFARGFALVCIALNIIVSGCNMFLIIIFILSKVDPDP
jgi:hypothetical protein